MREVKIPAAKLVVVLSQFANGSENFAEYQQQLQDFCRELGLDDTPATALSVARQIGDAMQPVSECPVCTNREVTLYSADGNELLAQIAEFLGRANNTTEDGEPEQ